MKQKAFFFGGGGGALVIKQKILFEKEHFESTFA